MLLRNKKRTYPARVEGMKGRVRRENGEVEWGNVEDLTAVRRRTEWEFGFTMGVIASSKTLVQGFASSPGRTPRTVFLLKFCLFSLR
jgi:hypothetical protein